MMTLSYHGAVRREVEEACDWYDERKDGLGDEFFQELEAVLVLIAEICGLHGVLTMIR